VFARDFDPQPFHLDDDAAKDSLFSGLVASGWHTAAITMRLLHEGARRFLLGILAEVRALERNRKDVR